MTARPRTPGLSDDLLADLRQTVAPPVVAPLIPGPDDVAPVAPPSPAVRIEISQQAWSSLSVRSAESGFVLSGGPLRLRLGFSRA